MKCNHSFADRVKPGSATIQALWCPKCKKVITKGKSTGKGFGVARVLRQRAMEKTIEENKEM